MATREACAIDRGSPASTGAEIRRLMLAFLAVGACIVAVHWPVLSAGALSIDDRQYLLENHLIRSPNWSSAGRFLSEVRRPSTVEGYYQPLSMISLMLDYAAGGRVGYLAPFHRTSLALHVVNTCLVVAFLWGLFGSVGPAAMAGLLFGLHPLTVEPIAWVGERKTLLATCFALASLLFYVRFTRSKRTASYVGSLLAFVLALMSKPTVTPLPILLLLLDFWPLGRVGRRALFEKLPFFAVAGVAGTIAVVSQSTFSGATYPAGSIFLAAIYNSAFYPLKVLWPSGLTSIYPAPEPLTLANPEVVAMTGVAIMLAGAWMVSLRWTRAGFVGGLFFLLALAPTFTNVGYSLGIAADKYAYLPLVGLTLPIAWTLGSACGRSACGRRTAAATGVVVLVAVALSFVTRRQIGHWRNTETLFTRMISLAPDSSAAHSGLAFALAEQGRAGEAIDLLQDAVARHPQWYDAHLNLGKALANQGRRLEAIGHYEAALRLNPVFVPALYELAVALCAEGRPYAAIDRLREAVQLKPAHLPARQLLAEQLVRNGDIAGATEHLAVLVILDPRSPQFRNNLANALMVAGRPTEAAAQCREAIRLQPAYVPARLLLAEVLASLADTVGAAEQYREVLRIVPGDRQAEAGLDVILRGELSQSSTAPF